MIEVIVIQLPSKKINDKIYNLKHLPFIKNNKKAFIKIFFLSFMLERL